MRTLLIETSALPGHVGICTAGHLQRLAELPVARRHARDLALTIQTLLSEEAWTVKDLKRVAVSIGPGSYTGLRVGIASGKTLAYALGIELAAVPTFAIIAHAAREHARLHVISDGLQGLVYRQRFAFGQPSDELAIASATDWAASVQAGDAIAGPGVAVHAALIPAFATVLPQEWHPTLTAMAAVAHGMPATSKEALFALEPLYLRGSSAEEKRAREAAPPL
jgi:tRNA threonylcarbamoyladenosine biosynthesis protein TsaB